MPTTDEDDVAERPGARFAQSEEQALDKFTTFEAIDPFPEIAPALLNSADISDYVAATGMVHPFYERKELLKPASYEVALLGKFVYWDEQGRKHVGRIARGKEFVLPRNSIAFVTLEPTFRLPQYIALRFNLKITHIYRGILLGTGPLVDPGFIGKLSIPLHNLTTNDYSLVGGESLIWMEFTKLSTRSEWHSKAKTPATVSRTGVYYDFPEEKKDFGDVEDYLRKADPHRPIRSSISDALQSAVRQAKAARRTNQFFAGLSIVAIVGVVIGLFSYFTNTNSYLRRSQYDLQTIRLDLEKEKKKSELLETQISEIRLQINSAQNTK